MADFVPEVAEKCGSYETPAEQFSPSSFDHVLFAGH
jgi:hypothetical protein